MKDSGSEGEQVNSFAAIETCPPRFHSIVKEDREQHEIPFSCFIKEIFCFEGGLAIDGKEDNCILL